MMAFLVSFALADHPTPVAFLAYYLILYVVCFLVVSQGQDALYDEATPGFPWKVAAGSLLLAAMLTKTRSSFATMFTDDITWTVLQAILWVGVFMLIYRFQPWHALGIGLATMLILTGLASMAVESLLSRTPTNRAETRGIAPPVRRPAFGNGQAARPDAPAAK